MAIHNTVLVDAGQVAANLFACASINGDAITTMYFCNSNTASTTFNLHVVRAGFTANANNIVYKNKTITTLKNWRDYLHHQQNQQNILQ